MISMEQDTIAAIATAMGQGSIAIIRLSGEHAVDIFEKVFKAAAYRPPYESHRLMYGHVMDDDTVIDECMGVVMLAPNSYTRENVCEIQTHGGYAAASAVMRRVIMCGARAAEPGEFTKRAFMNGRIDLSKAEAVMGIIDANSQAALRNQERQLQGGAMHFVHEAQQRIIGLLAGLEAHIDYPDEIDESEALIGLTEGLNRLIADLEGAVRKQAARIIREGLYVVLCGSPNAGKSTLFNRLIGEERAIVTEIPGTTRDVLESTFMLDGVAVHLMDTAGLRQTSDTVEQIGVKRAMQAIGSADAFLLLVDGTNIRNMELLPMEAKNIPHAVLINKRDLRECAAEDELRAFYPDETIISLSAKTGEGVDRILDFLRPLVQLPQNDLLTNERHLQLIEEAVERLKTALNGLEENTLLDFAAIDLHEALYFLGRITGDSVDEKLLDEVFEHFCVGK